MRSGLRDIRCRLRVDILQDNSLVRLEEVANDEGTEAVVSFKQWAEKKEKLGVG